METLPSSRPHSPPTIHDLRSKTCYICREEDSIDRPELPPRRWVHPCKCSLVAHELCLLEWIVTAQQNPARAANALNCPQCGFKYIIQSVTPRSLRVLDLINGLGNVAGRLVTAFTIAGTAVAFGTSIYIVSTAYGAYALREFLGEEVFNAALGEDPQSWPTVAYAQLPMIPFSLIAYRTPLSGSMPLFPLSLALLVFPFRHALRINGGRIVLDPLAGSKQSLLHPPGRLWPPSPYLTAGVLFPLVRFAYRRLFRHVARRVIAHASIVESQRRLNAGALETDIVIHIGRDDPQAAGAAQAEPPHAGDQQNGAEDAGREEGFVRRWRLTDRSFGRLVGGALLIPRISSFMGKLLLNLSKHSRLLRWILAIKSSAQHGPNAGLAPTIAGTLGVLNKGFMYHSRLWTDHDPVWWRNALGLGLFVVAKDCMSLWHLWLSKQQLDSMNIKSLPFTNLDEGELDLIQRPTM